MSKIWLTSDLHLSHNQPFIWEARGYESPDHMNQEQIRKWNEVVNEDDDVYMLGDCIMNDNVKGVECLKQLKGKIHIIAGNHCTDARIALYKELGYDIQFATRLKYKKKTFYLSHYQTITSNGEDKCWLATWNLHGHTHSTSKWCDFPFCYNVAVDAHNGYPVLLDDIIEDITNRWRVIHSDGKETKNEA